MKMIVMKTGFNGDGDNDGDDDGGDGNDDGGDWLKSKMDSD